MQPLLARDRLSTLPDAAAGRRIAVIGDAMLDGYLRGDGELIPPQAPAPPPARRPRVRLLAPSARSGCPLRPCPLLSPVPR